MISFSSEAEDLPYKNAINSFWKTTITRFCYGGFIIISI
ncbi:hypothetical protein BN863_13070 [Formosa agariphila KMM 3901]|uniref:Uncharacterized protein n=1 Tax=Formosa agariphila (strain DSM 15362 / KCTC 12365 / LMG 23005 / KMM 3901 / M-2Alg 35-1) TaxID=1347342 RepID=T2KLZ2_FORAG|nr:hypothetical protein BN863_13070 [Formosa agariphila KMM 3901]